MQLIQQDPLLPEPQVASAVAATTTTIPNVLKSVTFKETTTIVRFHESVGDFQKWHSIPDRKRFILEARDQTRAWIDKGGYDFLLKDTFHDASELSAQEKMNAYAQLPGDDYCRGLERHVCREHGLKRDSFKKGAVRAIVNEGRKRKERGMPEAQAWMQLGEISRKLSFLATRFARRTGAADALVARQGEDASTVQQLQREETAAHVVEKQLVPSSCPASQEDRAAPNQITVGQQRHNLQRSVAAVNGWCHGPRESCIRPAVPQEVAN